MPEGHHIHRLALDLERAYGGRPARVSSPQGRFADAAELLDGVVVEFDDVAVVVAFHELHRGFRMLVQVSS